MLNVKKEKLDKEIYKKYEKLVLNYFYYKTSDAQLSKDLSAETMSKIIINYYKKLNKKTLDNWVYTVTQNHFYDYVRKINRKKYKKYTLLEENSQNIEPVYITSDYEKQFDSVNEIMKICKDDALKNFYEYKYLKHYDNKMIIEKMNFSYQKIKDFDEKLIVFLKTNIVDDLFT
jgi:DNA-directed RNA polymerase specialized sigma24 family protein